MIETTMIELIFWGILQGLAVGFIASRMFTGLKVTGPIIMWKSHRGLKKVGEIAKGHKRLLEAYGDFGIILAFGLVGAWYVFRKVKGWKRIAYSLGASLFLLAPSISNFIALALTGSYVTSTNSIAMGGLGSEIFFQLILLCFGFSISLLYLIAQSAFGVVYAYLTGAAVQAAVAPALPGIAVKGSPFQIPWYGWFVFPILIFVHEMSHGLLVKAQGLKLKATGLLMFGIIPLGAFVEPDEKELQRTSPHKQMRVYSVGSAANYLTSFILMGLFVLAISPMLGGYYAEYSNYYDHPIIGDVLPESDGYGSLDAGMKILAINGTNIPSIAALHNVTFNAGSGAMLQIETDSGSYDVQLSDESMIGVTGLEDTFKPLPFHLEAIAFLISFLGLTVFFNFIVGVMNLLPMYPLDGGLMMEALITTKHGKKNAKRVAKTLTVIVLLLLFLNMLPLFIPSF